jgi:hypothetical protein
VVVLKTTIGSQLFAVTQPRGVDGMNQWLCSGGTNQQWILD